MTKNPYASPTTTVETSSQPVATCPACKHGIALRQVAFAPFPLFLRCEQCNARLIGGTFVRLQAIFITVTPLIVAGTMLFLTWPWSKQDFLFVGLVALFLGVVLALVNVPATVYWGRYSLRDPTSNAHDGG
jgi:hypothetical protein